MLGEAPLLSSNQFICNPEQSLRNKVGKSLIQYSMATNKRFFFLINLHPDRQCSRERFPARFVSSVIVQRILRSCRNKQAQIQFLASSPLWKGTVRHEAEPYSLYTTWTKPRESDFPGISTLVHVYSFLKKSDIPAILYIGS